MSLYIPSFTISHHDVSSCSYSWDSHILHHSPETEKYISKFGAQIRRESVNMDTTYFMVLLTKKVMHFEIQYNAIHKNEN